MMLLELSNSRIASSLSIPLRSSEMANLDRGIYIGRTQIYRIPFFIDAGELLNPHIAVVGMSGSGKTYFLKSFLARSRMLHGCGILIFDWNGEYEELTTFLGGKLIEPNECIELTEEFMDGMSCVHLSKLPSNNSKTMVVRSMMNSFDGLIQKIGPSKSRRWLVVLDEAWKVLGNSGELAMLFREGRKYGAGIVVASQLASDIDNEILANSACIAVFKLQNGADYKALATNRLITDNQAERIAGFNIGECMVRLAYKDGDANGSSTFIQRVVGVEIGICRIQVDNMQFSISNTRFLQAMDGAISDAEAKGKLVGFVEMNGRIVDLISMIRFLIKANVKRSDTVSFLRMVGIDDISIVRAYDAAADDNGR